MNTKTCGLTPSLTHMLGEAHKIAQRNHCAYVGVPHLFLALLEDNDGIASRILDNVPGDPPIRIALHHAVLESINPTPKPKPTPHAILNPVNTEAGQLGGTPSEVWDKGMPGKASL